MALSALQYVTLRAPTLAENANVGLYIDAAREDLNACYFGASYEKAVALLAAHTMTLSLDPLRAGGTGGAVTSKSEGALSIGFSSGSMAGTDWGQTSYGMELSRLMAMGGPSLLVTGVDDEC